MALPRPSSQHSNTVRRESSHRPHRDTTTELPPKYAIPKICCILVIKHWIRLLLWLWLRFKLWFLLFWVIVFLLPSLSWRAGCGCCVFNKEDPSLFPKWSLCVAVSVCLWFDLFVVVQKTRLFYIIMRFSSSLPSVGIKGETGHPTYPHHHRQPHRGQRSIWTRDVTECV